MTWKTKCVAILLAMAVGCIWALPAQAERYRGTLRYSNEYGWSIQTRNGTYTLPDDPWDQLCEGIKARIRLEMQEGEPVMTRLRLRFKGAGVDLKTNGLVFDLASPTVAEVPYIVMCLKVFNATCEPVTYTFPTSQRYDFQLVDSSDAVVWTWSDDKGFAQVVGQETLVCTGNKVLYYPAKFALVDEMGAPTLAPGVYTLRGWLTADNATMEATVTVEIK